VFSIKAIEALKDSEVLVRVSELNALSRLRLKITLQHGAPAGGGVIRCEQNPHSFTFNYQPDQGRK
jgi:hypothetical protein